MKIAIDGPAGSGKSTVAKLAAQNLGFKYIDTGAYYRWLTYQVLKHKIPITDKNQIVKLAADLDYENIDDRKIRSIEVTNQVSAVSAIKEVRPYIVEKQRKAAQDTNIVIEGRDIGSVVFPEAEVKIYLNASVAERASRRYKELLAKGVSVKLKDIEADIIRRDAYDSNRETSPLKKIADARELDTTGLTIQEVVEKIIALAKINAVNKEDQTHG
jgi:cytidylate kinase